MLRPYRSFFQPSRIIYQPLLLNSLETRLKTPGITALTNIAGKSRFVTSRNASIENVTEEGAITQKEMLPNDFPQTCHFLVNRMTQSNRIDVNI